MISQFVFIFIFLWGNSFPIIIKITEKRKQTNQSSPIECNQIQREIGPRSENSCSMLYSGRLSDPLPERVSGRLRRGASSISILQCCQSHHRRQHRIGLGQLRRRSRRNLLPERSLRSRDRRDRLNQVGDVPERDPAQQPRPGRALLHTAALDSVAGAPRHHNRRGGGVRSKRSGVLLSCKAGSHPGSRARVPGPGGIWGEGGGGPARLDAGGGIGEPVVAMGI